MPFGLKPQCSACKIMSSPMWRRGTNQEIFCNSCHLKRVTSTLRSQRQASKDSKKLIATKFRSSRGRYANGKDRTTKSSANRSRRSLFKRKPPHKSPEVVATIVASDRIYFMGLLYVVGDIVSVEDIEGGMYFAQIRGFLQDRFSRKYCVLTWLIPIGDPNPTNFDPALFVPGPDEDVPRPLECMEFVCRAPTNLFKAPRNHPPFVVPRQACISDLLSAAEEVLGEESSQ